MVADTEIPVLIVGGGPVGLFLALDLAWRGTHSLLVEQDPGTATVLLAKAGTLNERTMEFCRRLGIADRIANVGFPDDFPRDTVYCTSLTGFTLGRESLPSTKHRKAPPGCVEMLRKCPQHLFDPLLVDAVREVGLTDIRYSTRFEKLEQEANGVTVWLEDLESGESYTVRAQYLVGCDGAGSGVRKALGINFDGKLLDYSVSAMIRVRNLEGYHDKGLCERYMFIGTSGTWANLTAVDGHDLWRFTMVGAEEKLNPEQLDIDHEIRRAFGRNDIPFEVVRVVPWRRSQFTAEHYRSGRVLLAGDAAHTTSPTGGHGLNTGIGDAVSLGWMLDAMIKGWGGDHLLDAYEIERRPVAIRNSSSSTQNYKAWVEQSGREKVLDDTPEGEAARRRIGAELSAALQAEWHSVGIAMGYRYDQSPLVVPDGTPAPPDEPSYYIQTARPGHRAPHAWLPDGRSTIDLFGRGFVLLRFGPAIPDVSDLIALAAERKLPLKVVDVDDPEIAALYESPLALVRPDGHVAWRGKELPENVGGLLDTVRGAQPLTSARDMQRCAG